MVKPTMNVEIRDVEQAITDRFKLLRFQPTLERRFENDVAQSRCAQMISQNYIAIFIYHCFLFSDRLVIGDAFSTDLFMHFVVMTPVLFITNFVLATKPPVWLREGIETVAVVILTLTIVLVVSSSRHINRDILQWTIILVVLFASIMQRLRFRYLVATFITAQAMYSISLSGLSFSMDRQIMSNSIFLGILLFSLLGAYNLEHEGRMGYLLRLRDSFWRKELEFLSSRDALTGIGNRRALEAALTLLSGRDVGDSPRSTAVLLLDIDHFKLFNDTNGHQEGDVCLKRIAALVAGTLRSGEGTAYRFGGEEFLVLLDETSLSDAMLVADRIRLAVADARIPHYPHATTFMTISVGVAAGVFGRGSTPDSVIATADRALYNAKHKGRNQASSTFDRAMPPSFVSDPLRLVS